MNSTKVETNGNALSTWRARLSQVASAPLWSRAAVLLLVLCGIKLILIGGLGGSLYHEHWRVGTPKPTWFEVLNYGLFLLIVMTSVVLIGRRIPANNLKTIRWYNVGFVVTGLIFTVLSFHRLKSNYLYPVMTGSYGMLEVWHYLAMDLFFEPPYLSLYIFAYALAAWVLIRAKRETGSFWLLAGAAGLYLWLQMRELVICYELPALNCLGLAGLAGTQLSRRPLHWRWHLLPWVPIVGAWWLFSRADATLQRPDPYLVLLLSITLSLLGLANVLSRRTVGYAALSHFLPFYSLTFFILTNIFYPQAGNLSHLAAYGLVAVHYFWQEALLVVVLTALAMLLNRKFTKSARITFDVMALLLVLVGIVDLKLTQNMGCRLDWQAVIVNNSPVLLWKTIEPYMAPLVLGVSLLLTTYAGLVTLGSRLLKYRLPSTSGNHFALSPAPIIALILLSCVAPKIVESDKAEGIALKHVVATSPLATGWGANKLPLPEFQRTAHALNLIQAPAPVASSAHPKPPRDLNVLLVVMESSYNRYLSLFGAPDETQPQLKRYRDRMELFPNFYANFMNSLNARCTIVSGVYPCRPYLTYVNPRLPSPSIFEILHDRGYIVSLFDSCYRDYQRWNDYVVQRKIDHFYDAETMPGARESKKVSWGLLEGTTASAIKAQIAGHAAKREKFFLTYMPVAPHMPFDTHSKEFEKFDNGGGHLNNDYTGRYKNQLLYMDSIITGFINELARLGILDNTLILITNDHGEMVGEDDHKLGHGWNLEPIFANVPLIVMDPARRGYKINPTLGSHVDILPTLLDLLHIPLPPGELYQGVSLHDEPANRDKVVYINSHRPRAMIKGNRYLLDDRELGTTETAGALHEYEIKLDGVKTHFLPLPSASSSFVAELDRFERFQKSFLIHYAHYRDGMKERAASLAAASTKKPSNGKQAQ